MTFNVLEYCRALKLPLVFSSTREVYGDVHRFEEYAEEAADFAYTESPYSASKIASEAFIYAYATLLRPAVPRLPLLERLRALRHRPPADGARAAAVHAPAVAWRADHGLRRRREGARLHLHRRLRRRHRARRRTRLAAGTSRERDDQPRLRPGQHARPRRGADRRRSSASSRRSTSQPSLRRRGDALRRRHPQGTRRCSTGRRRRRSTTGIPKAVAWFSDWRAAHPEEDRPFERPQAADELEHGFKQPAPAGA